MQLADDKDRPTTQLKPTRLKFHVDVDRIDEICTEYRIIGGTRSR